MTIMADGEASDSTMFKDLVMLDLSLIACSNAFSVAACTGVACTEVAGTVVSIATVALPRAVALVAFPRVAAWCLLLVTF